MWDKYVFNKDLPPPAVAQSYPGFNASASAGASGGMGGGKRGKGAAEEAPEDEESSYNQDKKDKRPFHKVLYMANNCYYYYCYWIISEPLLVPSGYFVDRSSRNRKGNG
jgi:hypothetical protein